MVERLHYSSVMKPLHYIMYFMIAVTFASTFPSVGFGASANQCDQIVEQLKQMKKAQLTVQNSLISNHDMVADSLESYSDALSSSAGKAHKTVEDSMGSAASSLRKRGQKGQELASKLAEQTDELIKNVENCLK